jgi:hypothetical protein
MYIYILYIYIYIILSWKVLSSNRWKLKQIFQKEWEKIIWLASWLF